MSERAVQAQDVLRPRPAVWYPARAREIVSRTKTIDWDMVVDYYDLLATADYDFPFFVRWAARAGGPVLELMCGTGRVSLPVIASGADFTGVDYSPAFAARLREKLRGRGLTALIVDMDVRELELGRSFALIYCPFHAFAEILGESDRRLAFEAIRRHLAPDGRFVLTLHNPPVRAARIHQEWETAGLFDLPDSTTTVEISSRWRIDIACR